MDTLRLMARTENDAFFQKVNAVILISPDIEIDVFRKEAEPVLARGVNIYVIVSKDDRALRISARLRGEQLAPRVHQERRRTGRASGHRH